MEFPQPEPDDNDDVAWAIQTANTMYKRGDHAEAIRWLQRAADAAEEAGDDMRLLALARAAAEFANPKNATASAPPPPQRSAPPPPPQRSAPPPPQRSAPPPQRSAPPPPERSAPPPPERSAPPPAERSAQPPQRSAPPPKRPVAAAPAVENVETTPLITPLADVAPEDDSLDELSATVTPTTKLDAATRKRLEGLAASTTPTTLEIPARRPRPSDTGEEVTHVFQDPRTDNAKSQPRASAAPLGTSAATRSPLPLKRPFMSSVSGVNPIVRERAQPAPHAIHDSSPTPHRALRVCVLRATSPGTFLVRPLSPGEQPPPNGREALLVPLHPEDDFSH